MCALVHVNVPTAICQECVYYMHTCELMRNNEAVFVSVRETASARYGCACSHRLSPGSRGQIVYVRTLVHVDAPPVIRQELVYSMHMSEHARNDEVVLEV